MTDLAISNAFLSVGVLTVFETGMKTSFGDR
jgi:hypothetical protein